MLPSSAEDQKAILYALADPRSLQQQRQAIGGFVQRALGASAVDHASVALSEVSGWLRYQALGELWTRTNPVLPPKQDALRLAKDALIKLQRECSGLNAQWPKTLRGVALLPPVDLLQPMTL